MIQTVASRASANKWVIASTVLLGSFVSVMDVSIVNVATPQMLGTFGVSLDEITWVSVAYSIAERSSWSRWRPGGVRASDASAFICCRLGSLRGPRCSVDQRARWR